MDMSTKCLIHNAVVLTVFTVCVTAAAMLLGKSSVLFWLLMAPLLMVWVKRSGIKREARRIMREGHKKDGETCSDADRDGRCDGC